MFMVCTSGPPSISTVPVPGERLAPRSRGRLRLAMIAVSLVSLVGAGLTVLPIVLLVGVSSLRDSAGLLLAALWAYKQPWLTLGLLGVATAGALAGWALEPLREDHWPPATPLLVTVCATCLGLQLMIQAQTG